MNQQAYATKVEHFVLVSIISSLQKSLKYRCMVSLCTPMRIAPPYVSGPLDALAFFLQWKKRLHLPLLKEKRRASITITTFTHDKLETCLSCSWITSSIVRCSTSQLRQTNLTYTHSLLILCNPEYKEQVYETWARPSPACHPSQINRGLLLVQYTNLNLPWTWKIWKVHQFGNVLHYVRLVYSQI